MTPVSPRSVGAYVARDRIVDDYRAAWGRGDGPPLEAFWDARSSEVADPEALATLAALIREDLRRRYVLGERPAVADYLERFPALRNAHSRMISLVYEEFCLREEQGERPDPESFCDRYAPWRDSLLSQLRYHEAFSQLASIPARPVQFPEPGEHFLKFRLCAELGRGGVARVYLARDEELGGRKLALKLSPDRGAEPSIQGRLDHPHIVAVTHVEHQPETGLRGLFMPYWPGLPLDEVIDRIDPARTRPRTAQALWNCLGAPVEEDREIEDAGRPAWADFPRHGTHADAVAWVALKLAEALAHAHAKGIIHRDIKPANILLTRRGGPLLLDFNLAQGPSHAEEAEAAARGGTLPYMAPEQLQAFLDPERWDDVGPPTDLFALGLVLRELLIGERPAAPTPGLSTARAVAELLDRRLAGAPRPARAVDRAVPHALDAILARCLAPDPDQRYADAESLAEDLRRFLARRPPLGVVNPSRSERLAFWVRRNRRALTPSAVGLVVAASILGAVLRSDPGKSPAELVNLGSFEIDQGRPIEAIPLFREALRKDPKFLPAHQGLGAAAARQADRKVREGAQAEAIVLYAESRGHYARAIELARAFSPDPRDRLALHRDHAYVLIHLANDALARAAADEARQYSRLALRELEEAGLCLDRVAARYPSSGTPPEEHARIAAELSRKRFDLEDLASQAYVQLGDVASRRNDYRASVASYRKAKEQAERVHAYLESLHLPPQSPSRRNLEARLSAIATRLEADGQKLDLLAQEPGVIE